MRARLAVPSWLAAYNRYTSRSASSFSSPPAVRNVSFARDASPAWDSLGHLRLITALEEEFGTRFTMKEVGELDRFGKLRDRLSAL